MRSVSYVSIGSLPSRRGGAEPSRNHAADAAASTLPSVASKSSYQTSRLLPVSSCSANAITGASAGLLSAAAMSAVAILSAVAGASAAISACPAAAGWGGVSVAALLAARSSALISSCDVICTVWPSTTIALGSEGADAVACAPGKDAVAAASNVAAAGTLFVSADGGVTFVCALSFCGAGVVAAASSWAG